MELRMNKKISALAALLLFYNAATAQFEQAISEAQKLFPSAKAVQLKQAESINISLVKGKINIEEETIQQHYIINSSIYTAEKKLGFIPNYNTITNIEAQTVVYNNGKVSKFKVKNIEETGRVGNEIFYDDLKFKRFFYVGIQPESVTDLKYISINHTPHYISPYYFSPYNFPLLYSEYKVTVDKNIEIAYTLFGDTTGVKFKKTEEGRKVIYQWTLEKINTAKDYSGVISYRYSDPHVIVRIKKYEYNGKTENILNSLKDLYEYKYKYIKDVNKDAMDPGLKLIADSIKLNAKNQTEIIQGIFYWVKDHIKYIAFEDGDGGFTPRNANDIFRKRYGDCKDYSSIIKQMLNSVGVEAYLAWVGTVELPYSYSIISPSASNHMIVAVPYKGDYLYLDGTSFNTPYNMQSGFIQGKETFISINKDSFIINLIPDVEASKNKLYISNELKIENGVKLSGKGKLESTGLIRSSFLDRFYNKDQSDRDEANKNYLSSGNNKCKVLAYTIQNEYNRDSILRFIYSYEIDDYLKIIDNKYYINLNLNKTFLNNRIDTAGGRKIDYYFNNKIAIDENYYFEIPEGYQLSKVPEDMSINDNKLIFKSTYKIINNKIYHRIYYEFKDKCIKPNEFNSWNKNIEQITQNHKQLLVLEKKQ